MSPAPYAALDPTGLTLTANSGDFHHDLWIYLDYIGSRSIRRAVRTNLWSKNDLKDLTKRFSYAPAAAEAQKYGFSRWAAWIEVAALYLHLAQFDVHEGYLNGMEGFGTSDNYVVVNEKQLRLFGALKPAEQALAIQDALVHLPGQTYSEWYDPCALSRLDNFSHYHRETSTAPLADLSSARAQLLQALNACESGVWLSVEDLIADLKAHSPYFLLPKVIPPQRKREIARYSGFFEAASANQYADQPIAADAPDAFERVEGRFVERFLEGIPLLLRYVELAYDSAPYAGRYPERGLLRAFRVNDRFLHLMKEQTPSPTVTVQPNFEVIVVAEVYPSQLLSQLQTLAVTSHYSVGQSGPTVYTLRLDKQRVAASAAQIAGYDAVQLLQSLAQKSVAGNVITELREWTAHSEQFTLYSGYGLLEAAEPLADLSAFAPVTIAPGLLLVQRPEQALDVVGKKGIALMLSHPPERLRQLPDEAQTVFATPSRPLQPPAPNRVLQIIRSEKVQLRVTGDDEGWTLLQRALAAQRIAYEVDPRQHTLLYERADETQVNAAIESLAQHFILRRSEAS